MRNINEYYNTFYSEIKLKLSDRVHLLDTYRVYILGQFEYTLDKLDKAISFVKMNQIKSIDKLSNFVLWDSDLEDKLTCYIIFIEISNSEGYFVFFCHDENVNCFKLIFLELIRTENVADVRVYIDSKSKGVVYPILISPA